MKRDYFYLAIIVFLSLFLFLKQRPSREKIKEVVVRDTIVVEKRDVKRIYDVITVERPKPETLILKDTIRIDSINVISYVSFSNGRLRIDAGYHKDSIYVANSYLYSMPKYINNLEIFYDKGNLVVKRRRGLMFDKFIYAGLDCSSDMCYNYRVGAGVRLSSERIFGEVGVETFRFYAKIGIKF